MPPARAMAKRIVQVQAGNGKIGQSGETMSPLQINIPGRHGHTCEQRGSHGWETARGGSSSV